MGNVSRVLILAALISLAGCAAEKGGGSPAPALTDWERQKLPPACYTELNGRGDIIRWARTESQCRYQSTGQSWGYPGLAENIYRDFYLP